MRQHPLPLDYSIRIKKFRQNYGITQERLAKLLGVSYASINRWENGQSKPNQLAWKKILQAEVLGLRVFDEGLSPGAPIRGIKEVRGEYQISTDLRPDLDFSSSPDVVLSVVEGCRLAFGHLFNPTFATETSSIDPLPHQRIAVYEHMLPQPRLRFLLADDAGAGKTIMAGLYIREMLTRRLISRVLIVPPAGLVGNWERELRKLFSLPFRVVSGSEARIDNPFIGADSNLMIVSVDTLAGERTFGRLAEPEVQPYDLVVFDEAHKLSADREPDFRVRKTDRYKLAEAISGIQDGDPSSRDVWKLHWSARHLLLLTATPHMGKDFPYFCLWRLLEPQVISTLDAFSLYPVKGRRLHFLRRVKEELVQFDGTPLYPQRISDSLSYELTQGAVSEQALYDLVTDYLEYYYNRARILNRSAARLAMSVFQRRLASSTWALLCSFERRLEKLQALIADIRSGKITPQQLLARQRRLDKETHAALDEKTADEETSQDGIEENETDEEQALGAVVATSLAELEVECSRVEGILRMARDVYALGQESKFDKLWEFLSDLKYRDEKVLIFTEHRDTLNFLVRNLEGRGFTGQVAKIHGGMSAQPDSSTGLSERDEQVEFFRQPIEQGGARYLVATDAAGEGINLQVCWLMVNYDIPWNPARLEQRMGRIHRYGQKHDPVLITNLVAGKTREGKVLLILLQKLEKIRKELKSDKVFDVVGRLFEGLSLREYMEMTLTEEGVERVELEITGRLTNDQIRAIQEREHRIYGEGGDVRSQLPRLQDNLEIETYRRLLPGYVRRFVERAAPLVEIGFDGDLERTFSLRPLQPGALDALWPTMDRYPDEQRQALTFQRPEDGQPVIFLHPGEPLFDAFNGIIQGRFTDQALGGAVFVDPISEQPYLFHLAEVSVLRKAEPALPALSQEELLERRLVGLRQDENGNLQACPVESLLLLRGAKGIPPRALTLAALAQEKMPTVETHLLEKILLPLVEAQRSSRLATLPERESFLMRGFTFQEAELAAARARLNEKAQTGDGRARAELGRIRERQHSLVSQRDAAIRTLVREPELIVPGDIRLIAHALVIPSDDPEDTKRHDSVIEKIAMRVAIAYEEANGAVVKDVHTPELARAAGLGDYPGFDLFSRRPDGSERAIEVKGRAQSGDIDISGNEWSSACNHRDKYWLYVAFDCNKAVPHLLRVNDPWDKLITNIRDVLVREEEILRSAEAEGDLYG